MILSVKLDVFMLVSDGEYFCIIFENNDFFRVEGRAMILFGLFLIVS